MFDEWYASGEAGPSPNRAPTAFRDDDVVRALPNRSVIVTGEPDSLVDVLAARVGSRSVRSPADLDDESHDEALGAQPVRPRAVVVPDCTAQVAGILEVCAEHKVPVTARGSGSGLSGACIPADGGIVVSFERMNEILEIDAENHLAVVQPGVQLDQLDAELAAARARLPGLSRASTARPSAATSPPTPAACGR